MQVQLTGLGTTADQDILESTSEHGGTLKQIPLAVMPGWGRAGARARAQLGVVGRRSFFFPPCTLARSVTNVLGDKCSRRTGARRSRSQGGPASRIIWDGTE